MSTPFSDDSLLPRPVPAMPVSPHGDEYLLRSERALWERRAAVAADAASELTDAYNLLSAPIESNHFGDCVEGDRFFEGLVSAVSMLADQCRNHATRASLLGKQCRDAGAQIESVDREGAANLAT